MIVTKRHRRVAALRGLATDASAVALVEFALVLPLLLVLLFGILTYGNYYYMAHSVQQLANDAARAALPGLDAGERESLAEESVEKAALTGPIDFERVEVEAADETPFVRVRVRYDASDSPLFRLKLVPLPDPVISRSAAVRMGGL